MQCPRCGADLTSLTCERCRMAWPDLNHITPTHALYRAARRRWLQWTLEKRDAAQKHHERELLGI